MATPEENAIRGQTEILVAKDAYLQALRDLRKANNEAAPPEELALKLRAVFDTGNKCYNAVEQCIVQSELLGANRSEFWATDLANTAFNFLERIPDYWTVIRRFAALAKLDPAHYSPSPNAYFAMQNAVLIYSPDLVKGLRKRFEQAQLPTRGFTHPSKMNTRYSNFEKICMVAIVCFFLIALLAIAIWVPNPTSLGIFIFRVVTSLLAGAFGAIFIPGLFELTGTFQKLSIRAGGAAAFFVLVYLVNPPALVNNSPQSEKHDRAGSGTQSER